MTLTNARLVATSAAALVAYSTMTGPALAQPVSREELRRALTCREGHECAVPPAATRQESFPRKTRSFQFEPNKENNLKEIERKAKTGKLPSADIEVTFDFDSDAIGSAARPALDVLGALLAEPQFASSRFVLVGHTDAKGTEAYNQDLSTRRAAAVKRYLVEVWRIRTTQLEASGRGKSQLKNAVNPFASENRRVQVINHGAVPGSQQSLLTSPTAGERELVAIADALEAYEASRWPNGHIAGR